MGTSIAGLLILGLVLTASLVIWRASLSGNALIQGVTQSAAQREGERARTVPSITTAKGETNNNTLTLTVKNDRVTSVPVSDFDKMDLVVVYDSVAQPPVRLTYTTTNPPPDGQWTKTALSGAFEPDVWNPAENLTVLADLVGATCAPGTVTVGFPNGIIDTNPFVCGGFDLTFHSETTDINGTTYYQLKNETPADGTASTVSVSFAEETTGRLSPASNAGKFVYPLTGITAIPAANWDLTYRIKRDKADMGWVLFVNAIDISLGSTGAWTDIDLSSDVPVGATGVVVDVVNSGTTTDLSGVVRGKEDTRDYMSNVLHKDFESQAHRWQIVKLDSNRFIQGYVEHTDIDFKLLGYSVGSDPSYIINSGVTPNITPGAYDVWTTVDVSNYVTSNAKGVILYAESTKAGNHEDYGFREVGSDFDEDDRGLKDYSATLYMVGLNAGYQFEAIVDQDNTVNVYLVGQTEDSAVYYSADIPVATTPDDTWTELDADDYGVPTRANGLFFRVLSDGKHDEGLKILWRHPDSTDDWNGDIYGHEHYMGVTGLRSSDNVWDQYMEEDNDLEVWIAGYTQLIKLDVHADIDVVIRQADDTIRLVTGNPYLLNHVASTNPLSNDTWQTFTVTFAMPAYTVVDETDYLEIDIFAHAVTNISGEAVSLDFRIDDPTLAIADQMRAREVVP